MTSEEEEVLANIVTISGYATYQLYFEKYNDSLFFVRRHYLAKTLPQHISDE
jgi:hypothetical protein